MMQKLSILSAAQVLASLTDQPHRKEDVVGIIRAGAQNGIPVYWFNDLKISTCFSNFKYDLPYTYSFGPAQLTHTSLRELAVAESVTVMDFQFTDQDYALLEKMQGEKIDGDGNIIVFRHPATADGTVTVSRDQLFVYAHDLQAYAATLTPEKPDPERRLALLRQLGGDVKRNRDGSVKITGRNALIESEKTNGKKRTDPKTIHLDLKKAAQAEHDAIRDGQQKNPFTGLGQR